MAPWAGGGMCPPAPPGLTATCSSSSSSPPSSRPPAHTGTATMSSWFTAKYRGWKVKPGYLFVAASKKIFCKFHYLNSVIRATATLILQNSSREDYIRGSAAAEERHYHWIFCKSTKILKYLFLSNKSQPPVYQIVNFESLMKYFIQNMYFRKNFGSLILGS